MFNKAIVAFILSLLAPLGVAGDTTIETVISMIVMAVITALGVFITPNKK